MNRNPYIEQLIARLHSDDSQQRSDAISALEASELDQVAAASREALTDALSDSNARVRKVAARALGTSGDVSVLPQLIGLFRDKWVQPEAIRAVIKLGPLAAEPVQALVNDSDPLVRTAAIVVLEQLASRSNLEYFVKALGDTNISVRRAAATALGSFADELTVDELAVQALLTALQDPEVASTALTSLQHIGPQAGRAIIASLWSGNKKTRRAAVGALPHLLQHIALDNLLAVAGSKDLEVRRAIITAFGSKRDVAALPTLQSALNDRDLEVRIQAARSLQRIASTPEGQDFAGFQALVPQLSALAHHRAPRQRAAAISALAAIQDSASFPVLLNALYDKDGEVRGAAVHGLIRHKTSLPEATVLALLRDPDEQIRYSALRGLFKESDTFVVPELIRMLRDSSSLIRATAASVLGYLRDPRAMVALAELLEDNAPYFEPGVMYLTPPTVDRTAAGALAQISEKLAPDASLFTAYYLKEVPPNTWHPLHLYCYTPLGVSECRRQRRAYAV